MERIPARVQRLFSVSWKALKWTAFVAVVMACALGLYLYHNLNNEIRTCIEQKLAQHYHDMNVSIRSARFIEGKGIEIRGLVVAQRSSAYQSQEVGSIDEIIVYCTTDPRRLASGDFQVHKVVAKRPRLVATLDENGTPDFGGILPFPQWGEGNAEIQIWDGSLLIADRREGSMRRVLEGIDLLLKTDPSSLEAPPGEKKKRFQATVRNQEWESATISGAIDERSSSFLVQGSVANLRVGSSLWKQIPQQWDQQLQHLEHLQASSNVNFHVAGNAAGLSQFTCTMDVYDGTWSDPALPNMLEKIQCQATFSQSGIRVERFRADYESGTLHGQFIRQGWTSNSPIQVFARLTNFNLHQRLSTLLPADMQGSWNRYRPSGPIDATVELAFNGYRWTPEIHATCRGTNFVYEEFPYPVTGARGKIDFARRRLTIDLVANAGQSEVQMSGDVLDPGPNISGTVNVKTRDPVRWDLTLEQALEVAQPDVCKALKRMQIDGWMHVDFSAECSQNADQQDKRLRVDVVDASVRYEKFPYPIEKIHGPIRWENGVVTFEQLEGYNDSGHISCWGTWREVPDDPRGLLELKFACKDVPLDDEFKGALPSSVQEGWQQLRPRGSIDHMDVQLIWPAADGEVDLTVEAQKWQRSRNVSGRAISLEPVAFPYVLDEVVGSARFRDGRVELTAVTARHGNVQFSTSAECVFPEDNRWQIRLHDLRIENIIVDRDLLLALPPQLEQALQRLQIGPLMHAEGDFVLSRSEPNEPPRMGWDITVHMAGGNLSRQSLLTNVYGSVRFQGRSDATGARTTGELMLDSVHWRGIPFSSIKGPLWIDSGQCLLGRHVPREEGKPPRHVTATALGGSLAMDSVMQLSGDFPFRVDASLGQAAIAQLLIDLGQPNHSQTEGKLFGTISLTGNLQGTHTYEGNGSLQLREANLYQLPLAVAMLKVLSARFPDSNAFNSGEVAYRVAGDYVYLDDIRLAGDAVSLKGYGEANLDGRVSMRFYTEFGNQSFDLPLVRNVLGEASRSLLVLHVGGTIDQPTTEQEIFPTVNEALEQWFPPRTVRLPIGSPPLPATPVNPSPLYPLAR